MAIAGEIIEKSGTDIVATGHGGQVFPSLSRKQGMHVAQGRGRVTGWRAIFLILGIAL
jgi:hypothetical protein